MCCQPSSDASTFILESGCRRAKQHKSCLQIFRVSLDWPFYAEKQHVLDTWNANDHSPTFSNLAFFWLSPTPFLFLFWVHTTMWSQLIYGWQAASLWTLINYPSQAKQEAIHSVFELEMENHLCLLFLDRRLRWSKSVTICFGRGLCFPVKTLENMQAMGVRSTVTPRWLIHSMLKQHKGLSQCRLLGFSLLLFRVPRQRVFLGCSGLLSD